MLERSIKNLCRQIYDEESIKRVTQNYFRFLATVQDDIIQKRLLEELIKGYVALEKRVDNLLKNTLPQTVADEIKDEGKYRPRPFDCTILFTDIAGFTKMAERLPGEVLLELLNRLFGEMDDVLAELKGTKIKTIGDSYMAVFGAPVEYEDHAVMAVRAGLSLVQLVNAFNMRNNEDIQMRIGIHTGRVMAGVVGKERMQFDIFGDNVNIASRFESSGEVGKVNVSQSTYMRTQNLFLFEERGEIPLKNKGYMKAYFVLKEL